MILSKGWILLLLSICKLCASSEAANFTLLDLGFSQDQISKLQAIWFCSRMFEFVFSLGCNDIRVLHGTKFLEAILVDLDARNNICLKEIKLI